MNDKHLDCIKKILKQENIVEYKVINETDEFKGDNYMGIIVRIKVIGKHSTGDEIVKRFVLKVAPSNENVRKTVAIKRFYRREVFAYQNIFTEFEKLQNKFNLSTLDKYKFIKCYDASLEEPNEFLIMEDAEHDNFVPYPRKESLDFNHVKCVLENLARYHALSFALKKWKPEKYRTLALSVEMDQGFSQQLNLFVTDTLKNALKYIKNVEHRERFEKVATYKNMYTLSSPEVCDPYNVLCHGDFWISNILFKYEDKNLTDMRFIDWQLNFHSSPVTDISQFIFSVTEQSLRNAHYEDLLSIYYRNLFKNLRLLHCDPEEMYPESVFRQQLKDVLIYGLLTSTVALTFALREPEDITNLEASVVGVVEGNEYDFEFKTESSANNFSQRLGGVIENFIELGII